MADRADHVAQLVLAARAGDASAFTQLVHAFQDIAVAYATSILRDYHLAQDAAQEAFVHAHRTLPELRDPAAFPAWFRTIVFKHCDGLLIFSASRRTPSRPASTPLAAACEIT